MRLVPPLLAATFLLAACQAQSIGPSDSRAVSNIRTLTRTAPAGRETRIYTWARFLRQSCEPDPNLIVAIETPPQHGTATTRPGTVTPTEFVSGDAVQCAGKPTTGVALFYRSEPGFHGPDTMTIIESKSRITVNVQVN